MCASHTLLLVTGPVHSSTISTSFFGAYSTAAISAQGAYRTHCHLCPTRYLFLPEPSEACEGKVTCLRTQHQDNVTILRGEKRDISLKILHQAGFETARQTATSQSSTLKPLRHIPLYSANTKHLYNICTTLAQRLRR